MRWALSRQISSWVPKTGVRTPGTRVRIVAGSAAVVAPISAATTLLSLKILASAAASGLIGSTVAHLNQSASSAGYIVLRCIDCLMPSATELGMPHTAQASQILRNCYFRRATFRLNQLLAVCRRSKASISPSDRPTSVKTSRVPPPSRGTGRRMVQGVLPSLIGKPTVLRDGPS